MPGPYNNDDNAFTQRQRVDPADQRRKPPTREHDWTDRGLWQQVPKFAGWLLVPHADGLPALC